jgi:hypothetical protein
MNEALRRESKHKAAFAIRTCATEICPGPWNGTYKIGYLYYSPGRTWRWLLLRPRPQCVFILFSGYSAEVPRQSSQPRDHRYPRCPHTRKVVVRSALKHRKNVMGPLHEPRSEKQSVREKLRKRSLIPESDGGENVENRHRENDRIQISRIAERRHVKCLPHCGREAVY